MADELLKGFAKFRRDSYEGAAPLMPRLVEEGQSPDYFIISCIDSRSNPGTIFRPKPGTFFAHKAMGAIVRPYKKGTALAAALQFALEYNKVKEIVLLGHTGCGAIRALVEKLDDDEIFSFIDVAKIGLSRAKKLCGPVCAQHELLRYAEEQIVLQSAENLKSYPSVAKALAENRLEIKSWLFDMESGNLMAFNSATGHFEPMTDFGSEEEKKESQDSKNAKTY